MNFLWANNQPRTVYNVTCTVRTVLSPLRQLHFHDHEWRDGNRGGSTLQETRGREQIDPSTRQQQPRLFDADVLEIEATMPSLADPTQELNRFICAERPAVRIASLNEPPITIMQIFLINGDPSAAACFKSEKRFVPVSPRFQLPRLSRPIVRERFEHRERERDRVDPSPSLTPSRAPRWISSAASTFDIAQQT